MPFSYNRNESHPLEELAAAFTKGGLAMDFSVDGKIRKPGVDENLRNQPGVVHIRALDNDCQRILATNEINLADDYFQGVNGTLRHSTAILYVIAMDPRSASLELVSTLKQILKIGSSLSYPAAMPVSFYGVSVFKFRPINDSIREGANFFEVSKGRGVWIAEQELEIVCQKIES